MDRIYCHFKLLRGIFTLESMDLWGFPLIGFVNNECEMVLQEKEVDNGIVNGYLAKRVQVVAAYVAFLSVLFLKRVGSFGK